ncbi:hypothetical protein BH09PSE5_BH09PSE5_06830 [soil metagenome]
MTVARQPINRVPPAAEQEEVTVVILRFRGSAETVGKGMDAIGQALASLAPPAPARMPSRSAPLLSENHRVESRGPETDDDDGAMDEYVETPAPKPDAPARKRAPPKFDDTLDLEAGGGLAVFVTARNPQSDVDKYLVAALWLTEKGGKPEFTTNQVFTCFRALKWDEAKDFSQPMRSLKQKRSYFSIEKKGFWKLTQPGLAAARAVKPK